MQTADRIDKLNCTKSEANSFTTVDRHPDNEQMHKAALSTVISLHVIVLNSTVSLLRKCGPVYR